MTDRDRAWEDVQEKAFTHWVNNILSARNLPKVEDLRASFSDGITLVHFVELLCDSKLKSKWSHTATKRIHKIENSHLCLEFLKKKGVESKYLTISSEDFVDGNLKLVLGFLWMLFRKFSMARTMGVEDVDSTTEALLNWCRKTTSGYKDVNIQSFKTGFNSGNAFLALVHAYNNDLTNYEEYIASNSSYEILETSFLLAEKHMGVPQLLNIKEVLDGTIDDRSLVLYLSLYYNAFVSADERNKIESESNSIKHQITELKTMMEDLTQKHEKTASELEKYKQMYYDTCKEKELLSLEMDGIRQSFSKYRESVDCELNIETLQLAKLRTNLLQHVEDLNFWKKHLNQDREYESENIQLRTESELSNITTEEQIIYLSKLLDEENKKLQNLLKTFKEMDEFSSCDHSLSATS